MKGTKRKHRLLSILLSLMLVVGLMPAMSLTAFATTTISKVEASGIKAPVVGESVDSSYVSVTLPPGGGYEQVGVTLWYEDVVSDEAAPFYGPFAGGHKYYAVVSIEATGDYQFANDITVLYEGKAPYSQKVNGSNTMISFTVEFTCPTNIDPVTVTELNFTYDPEACKIVTSLTEGELDSKIRKSASMANSSTIAEIFEGGLSRRTSGYAWYGIGDGLNQVESGKKYAIKFRVRLNKEYCWPDGVSSKDMSKVKITVNGNEYKPAPSEVFINDYWDVFIYYIPDDQIKKIKELMATPAVPEPFKSPVYDIASDYEGYTVTVEKWYSDPYTYTLEPGTVMNETDKFCEDKWYMVELKFTAADGYTLLSDPYLKIPGFFTAKYNYYYSNSKTAVVRAIMQCPLHEHNYQSVTTKATASKNGSVVTKCSVCGDVKSSETIYYPKTMKFSTTNYTYSGGVKKPAVSVIDADGKTISSGNYNVSYATGRKNVGRYKVTVTFKGDKYSGSKYTYFYIKPKGSSISKVTGAKKAFTVKWKKQSAKMAKSTITGYQIRYSTSSKMTSAKTKTVKGYKYTSKKITKLKAKKKYYIQVRTYKTVSGKTYYSSWSGVKSVKTK